MKQLREIGESVKLAVANQNWYAAMALALAIPDICGKISNPTLASQDRYAAWFDLHLGQYYQARVGGTDHIFMSGTDCYALRCSFLHQGGEHLEGRAQAVRDALKRFHFLVPTPGITLHRNQYGKVLQLQTDIFCLEIVGAMERWLEAEETIQAIAADPPQILTLYGPDDSVWNPGQKLQVPFQ